MPGRQCILHLIILYSSARGIHSDMKKLFLVAILIEYIGGQAQPAADAIAVVGQPLPVWKPGYLDLHHINTGRGNAAFYIFPDGTSLLFDAGELDPTSPRTTSKRNTPIRPNDTRKPFEWIASYIQQVDPGITTNGIDYAIISHFHDDHFGGWYPGAPLSKDGKFSRTGITGVVDLLSVHCLLTRDYHYPVDPARTLSRLSPEDRAVKNWNNYLAFVEAEKSKGMGYEFLHAGSPTQVHLVHQPALYKNF